MYNLQKLLFAQRQFLFLFRKFLKHVFQVFKYFFRIHMFYISFYHIHLHNKNISQNKTGHYEAKECFCAEFYSLAGLQPHDVDELALRAGGNYVYIGA